MKCNSIGFIQHVTHLSFLQKNCFFSFLLFRLKTHHHSVHYIEPWKRRGNSILCIIVLRCLIRSTLHVLPRDQKTREVLIVRKVRLYSGKTSGSQLRLFWCACAATDRTGRPQSKRACLCSRSACISNCASLMIATFWSLSALLGT